MLKRLALILLCLSFLLKAPAQPLSHSNNSTTGAIAAEVRRLKGVLAALKLPAAEAESFTALLNRSERAAQAGHVYLGLHILQVAAPVVSAYEFKQAQAELEKNGLAAFEQEWRRRGPELLARQRRLATPQRWPLAVRAVVERSLTQVQPTYQASLPYSQESSVGDGLFYLGLVQAHLDFVAFCRGLKFDGVAGAPPLHAVAPELAELEREVLAAYRQYDTPEKHPSFIRVNSLLKVAQELQQERRYSGAWMQALEAWRALIPITVTTDEGRVAAALRTQSETFRAQLSKAATDHSLGWLYWQMAEAALAADDLKQANVVLHYVLPRYFKSLTRNKR